jgi:hypothetical protein
MQMTILGYYQKERSQCSLLFHSTRFKAEELGITLKADAEMIDESNLELIIEKTCPRKTGPEDELE